MPGSSKRGFGSMNQDKQRAIARKGGQAGHAKGTAHEFTPEEAREAGRKGGEAVSRDREHMAEIARKGSREHRGGSQAQAGGSTRDSQRGRRAAERQTPPTAMEANDSTDSATDLLRADHERVKSLFHDYETADDEDFDEKKAIADKVFMELNIHAKIEEEIFYPAVREQAQDQGRELVDEGMEEHDAVKGLIEELRGMSVDEEEYENKFQDLIDNVLHHVEEEESEMLPLAEEKMSDRLQHLATELVERKRQLRTSAHVS
jgi:general stress protein YciG